jgi:hypothetical protein
MNKKMVVACMVVLFSLFCVHSMNSCDMPLSSSQESEFKRIIRYVYVDDCNKKIQTVSEYVKKDKDITSPTSEEAILSALEEAESALRLSRKGLQKKRTDTFIDRQVRNKLLTVDVSLAQMFDETCKPLRRCVQNISSGNGNNSKRAAAVAKKVWGK